MKKFTAIVLAMLMVIGMVGNVCAEYEAGSIAAIVGSAIELDVDVAADVKVKASGADKYSNDEVVEVTYKSSGRTFDFTAVVALAEVEAQFEAGKALAKKAFEKREVNVSEYMAAFDTLSVTGSFEIVATYAEGLTLPAMSADMVTADETLFTWGDPVDDGAGTVTLTVTVADGVTAKDVEEKLFGSKIAFTCEGVEVEEVGEYEVAGSFTGTTTIKEGDAEIAEFTYTAAEDAVTAKVAKRSGGTSSSDAGTSTTPTKPVAKDPVVTVKDNEVTVSKNETGKSVSFEYKAEDIVADTIVVVDAEGNVVDATYDAETGKITLPEGADGKFTVEAATMEEVMILTIEEEDAHVFGDEKTNDVAPKIVNDRTMLPARFVAENLGAEVAWDEAARKVTITKDDVVIEITIDAEIALVNGKEVKLDSPAFIENDRTYTPIRFISENLGAKVFWNGETQKVTIVK